MRPKDLLQKHQYIGCLIDVAIIAIFNIFAQGKGGLVVPSHINVNFS
jgi:hypothetical protein